MKQTIKFKSTPDNFKAEQLNKKRNTVRLTDDWDYNRWFDFVNADEVQIANTLDNTLFKRDITNKTVYKGIAIISW